MPRPIPKHKVKIVCQDCGWYLIVTRGSASDVLRREEYIRMVEPRRCPKCGSDKLATTMPTAWERISPLEMIREREFYSKLPASQPNLFQDDSENDHPEDDPE